MSLCDFWYKSTLNHTFYMKITPLRWRLRLRSKSRVISFLTDVTAVIVEGLVHPPPGSHQQSVGDPCWSEPDQRSALIHIRAQHLFNLPKDRNKKSRQHTTHERLLYSFIFMWITGETGAVTSRPVTFTNNSGVSKRKQKCFSDQEHSLILLFSSLKFIPYLQQSGDRSNKQTGSGNKDRGTAALQREQTNNPELSAQ